MFYTLPAANPESNLPITAMTVKSIPNNTVEVWVNTIRSTDIPVMIKNIGVVNCPIGAINSSICFSLALSATDNILFLLQTADYVLWFVILE